MEVTDPGDYSPTYELSGGEMKASVELYIQRVDWKSVGTGCERKGDRLITTFKKFRKYKMIIKQSFTFTN